MVDFTGLLTKHFETYAPNKCSSMVYNLARMHGKDTLLSLADHAQSGLDEQLVNLARSASDEIPNISNNKRVDCQWVYWYRDRQERDELSSFLRKTPLNQNAIFDTAPQHKHLTLAIVLRHTELWVGLQMNSGATIDRRNLRAKLSKSWERDQMSSLLRNIAPGAITGTNKQVELNSLSSPEFAELSLQCLDSNHTWQLGYQLPQEAAIEKNVDLVDSINEWLGSLIPVYRYIAWSRDNDFIEATKQLQQEKAQKRHEVRSMKAGDQVRLTAGLFSGKIGAIEEIDTKGRIKVTVGNVSVLVPGDNVIPLR